MSPDESRFQSCIKSIIDGWKLFASRAGRHQIKWKIKDHSENYIEDNQSNGSGAYVCASIVCLDGNRYPSLSEAAVWYSSIGTPIKSSPAK